MDVLLLALLTTCNAIFAMSEMALSTSRRARLAVLVETGDAGAAAALRLMDEPRIASWKVTSENFESIHNHSAYAELFGSNE